MAKPKTRIGIIRQTKQSMENLGVYREEFDPLIEIYADMLYQSHQLGKQFENDEVELIETSFNSKGVVSEKKSATVQIWEALRKDILAYSDKLCLNPKALNDEKTRQDKNKPQGLDAIISSALGGESDE